MKRTKIIGLALVAVFALTAVAASAASAATLPFIEGQTTKAEYKGTVPTAGGTGTLETANGNTVKCTKSSSTGTAESEKKVKKVVVTFEGCEATIGGIKAKCNTAGEVAGKIVTKELEGELGYINKATPSVGLDLWPASRTAEEKTKHTFNALFVEFECTGFAKSKVRGSIIGELTPVNGAAGKTLTLTYKKGAAKGEQLIKKMETVEGGVEDVLESSLNNGAFEKSNEETTNTVTFAENVILKA